MTREYLVCTLENASVYFNLTTSIAFYSMYYVQEKGISRNYSKENEPPCVC